MDELAPVEKETLFCWLCYVSSLSDQQITKKGFLFEKKAEFYPPEWGEYYCFCDDCADFAFIAHRLAKKGRLKLIDE